MSQLFSNLNPAEIERLDVLAEEAAEVIQMCSKIKRHGWASKHPNKPELGDNRQRLESELGDLDCAVGRLCRAGDVSLHNINHYAQVKTESAKPYLHHQP